MGKSKIKKEMAVENNFYESYLSEEESNADAKSQLDSQHVKNEEVTKSDNEKRKKIRHQETFLSRMMTILFASFGFNISLKQPIHSQSFDGIIILSIIPNTDAGRDTYYNSINGYLTTTVRTRLGINAAKFTVFTNLIGGPRVITGTPPNTNSTAGTWNFVYPQQKIKATTTETLTIAKDGLIVSIDAAITDMFSDIADSAITATDTSNLNIKPKSARKKAQLTPEKITELIYPVVESQGGLQVLIISKQAASAKRGKKLNKAVSIELSYVLINAITGVIPTTVPDNATVITVTKTRFLLELDSSAAGMRIVVFARWVYPAHPKQSGGYKNSGNDIVS